MPKYRLTLLDHTQSTVGEIPCEQVDLGKTLVMLVKPENMPELRQVIKEMRGGMDYEHILLLPPDVRFAILEEVED